MHAMRHAWAVVVLGLAASGCSDPLGPESERAYVGLHYTAAGPLADPSLATFRLTNGDWHTVVSGRVLAPLRPEEGWPVPVASPGRLEAEMLLQQGGDTLALARLDFEVQRRWIYGLDVWIGMGDPRQNGLMGSWIEPCGYRVYAYPLAGSGVPADSLYIVLKPLPPGVIVC